jgi:hypothetical protein
LVAAAVGDAEVLVVASVGAVDKALGIDGDMGNNLLDKLEEVLSALAAGRPESIDWPNGWLGECTSTRPKQNAATISSGGPSRKRRELKVCGEGCNAYCAKDYLLTRVIVSDDYHWIIALPSTNDVRFLTPAISDGIASLLAW